MKTINQHMQLTQKQRQNHIDLTDSCYGFVITKGKNKGKLSPFKGYAKTSLLDFHQIENFSGRQFQTCHLCPNHSQAPHGFVCINPKHLYFGTAKENNNDYDSNGNPTGGKVPCSEKSKRAVSKTGKRTGAKNLKKAMKEGRHNCQKHHICPVCGEEGKSNLFKRWHFDNCKHRK